MLGYDFRYELIRKYVAVFGTLFRDVNIFRDDNSKVNAQMIKVPISYGPREKFLAMVKQKPDSKRVAINLPRMAFQIVGMDYDPERRFPRNDKFYNPKTREIIYELSPWNINFELYIMAKSQMDMTKIAEQVLYFFNPDWTVTVQLLEDIDRTWDVPIIHNGTVSIEDVYEGSFDERRMLIWTISFTMKTWLLGPLMEKKQIKFISINTFNGLDSTAPAETTTIQPGMTANGEPTTDPSKTIPYQEINEDDNWDYIIQQIDYIDPETENG